MVSPDLETAQRAFWLHGGSNGPSGEVTGFLGADESNDRLTTLEYYRLGRHLITFGKFLSHTWVCLFELQYTFVV